ncbi:MFS transporter [Nonomuraea sp. NPDC000554]|uniref:MFS transporter n=1 Tax=Nonomuraea sp. NPDC000554 TaxID=3154259 RepID=UPI00331C37ED
MIDPEQGHPRRWKILAAVSTALLLIVVDNTVVNVALPSIGAAFDASNAQQQAVIDAYVVVFAGLLIAAGAVSDRHGHRRVLLAGLTVLGVASGAAAAAWSVWWLVAMRALMGVGAALVMPATLAVLVRSFPPRERPKAFAVWGAVASVAMAVGPALGGFLVSVWSWAGVFVVNVPLVAVAVAAIIRWVPESRAPHARAVDPFGAVLVTLGMVALTTAAVAAGERGFTTPLVIGGALTAIAALAVFAWRQRHAAVPVVDFSLYRERRFAGGSIAAALLTVGTGSVLFVLAQHLQLVMVYDPWQAGLAVTPVAAGTVLGSIGGGRAPARIGPRLCIVLGFGITAAGFLVLAALSPASPYLVVAAGLLLAGAGTGFAAPATTSVVLAAVPTDRAGMGSALNDTHQQLGIALGVAVLGGLLSTAYRAELPGGLPQHARGSLAATLAHAGAHPRDTNLVTSALHAFTHAQTLTMVTAAGCATAGALIAAVVLRRDAPSTQAEVPARRDSDERYGTSDQIRPGG